MAKKFGRSYRLTLGNIALNRFGEWFKAVITPNNISEVRNRTLKTEDGEFIGGYLAEINATGTVITDRQMTASVQYTETNGGLQGSPATIVLKNLEEEVVDLLGGTGRTYVNLQAGYYSEYSSEDLPMVYMGEVDTSTTTRDPRTDDLVTVLTLKSSLSARKFSKVSNTFEAPFNTIDVIQYFTDVFESIGYPLYRFTGEPIYATVDDDLTIDGKLFDEFDSFMKNYASNLTYSIAYGRLTIWDRYKYSEKWGDIDFSPNAVNDREPTQVTFDTFYVDGSEMTGVPAKVVNSTDKKKEVSDVGLNFQILLDGRIKVGSLITVTGLEEKDGTYLVRNVSHKLDYRGKDWVTDIEAYGVGRKVNPKEDTDTAGASSLGLAVANAVTPIII